MVFLLIALFLNSPLLADTIYDYPFKDPYVATLVAAANNSNFKGFKSLWYEARSDRREIPLLEGKNKLLLNLFKQDKPAPLIFVIAGLGGGGNSGSSMLLAELFFKAGYNVVTLPNSFSWQYSLAMSDKGLPGYLPHDSKEYYQFLVGVNTMLRTQEKLQITAYKLVGYSFGANLAAFLMNEDSRLKTFNFNQALLINPPIDMEYSTQELDRFYSYGKSIRATQRDFIFGLLQNTVLELWKSPSGVDSLLKAVTALKLSTDEIQWVIGQSFRESLQDIVFGSQQIHDLGILHTPVSRYSQNARIEEAASINFEQYLKSFVYPQRSLPGTSENDFIIETTISSISEILKTNSRIFVIHNADDIFLENHDFTYLQFIFGSRLTVYPYGGHLGNIWMKQNQKDMLSLIR